MTLTVARIEPVAFRVPIERKVVTSFGAMTHRPGLLVRVEDADGAEGWGEVFCNWPPRGFAHRAMLVADVAAPLLEGKSFPEPEAAWRVLTETLHILAVQTGEPGPIANIVAGIDIALWDLWARRKGEPLWRTLGGTHAAPLPVYASGINSVGALEIISACRRAGHTAFKVKIGFDAAADRSVAMKVASTLAAANTWMVDVNQGWDIDTACREAPFFAGLGATWIEEPIAADRPDDEWRRLADIAGTALAGGENLAGTGFDAAIQGRWLDVIQPDICKWGGLSGCREIARAALARGKRYCPHYLGGGIGLVASAHLLAAVGGDGLLELDVNPNPLREYLAKPYPSVADGCMTLGEGPGLGVVPDIDAVREWRVDVVDLQA